MPTSREDDSDADNTSAARFALAGSAYVKELLHYKARQSERSRNVWRCDAQILGCPWTLSSQGHLVLHSRSLWETIASRFRFAHQDKREEDGLTDNKSREEGIDPPHNQRLWDHHSHLALHHAHHTLHGRRITHGVWSRFPSQLRLSQELSLVVRLHHVGFASSEGGRRENLGVGA